ncbi:MAG: cobyric acid synthase [Candidatus Aerophobetes bacterium]|nr:cobyric acid synthase [Candidatus Aerophobetes bacterium]
MSTKSIMIQGTGSGVGKSVLVAALCRIFKRDGYGVAPFKAQNMALNSYVTIKGEEMGRAQVVQAEAAKLEPEVEMNPILIKPTADTKAQVIVLGKPIGNFEAMKCHLFKSNLSKVVRESYQRLAKKFEIIVIEGAGSPAEINLMKRDIVNMRVARMAKSPVILVGDIDKGGVFAWIWGTIDLLPFKDKRKIKGVIINKFRGDKKLLEPGLKFLEKKIHSPVLGVIPYFKDIRIREEDSLSLKYRNFSKKGEIKIEVVYLPHLSNFTDFDYLKEERGVSFRFTGKGESLSDPDVVIIPGSKNTLDDLFYLRERGYDRGIINLATRGKIVVGICGGFQMLGAGIEDPHHLESHRRRIKGLNLLDVYTRTERKRITHQVKATPLRIFSSSQILSGYEIHTGRTKLGRNVNPLFRIIQRSHQRVEVLDGAINKENSIFGTYIHGIFDNDGLRREFINYVRKRKGLPPLKNSDKCINREEEYEKLADLVENNLNKNLLYQILKRGL